MPTAKLSTWPEAAYALSLTKHGTWHAQRRVLEVLCAFAAGQQVIAGDLFMSDRDLADRMYRSVSSAAELVDKLVERRVLRRVDEDRRSAERDGTRRGTAGSAPSRYQVWHWTRWEVPWVTKRERLDGLLALFAVAEIPPQPWISARILIRAQPKMGPGVLSAAATLSARVSPGIPRAGSSTAIKDGQVNDSRSARYGGPPIYSLSNDDGGAGVGVAEEEENLNLSDEAQALVETFARCWGLRKVWGAPLFRLVALAERAAGAGCLEAVVIAASERGGRWKWQERLDDLERLAKPAEPIMVDCEACEGRGLVELEDGSAMTRCQGCGGRGKVSFPAIQPPSTMAS